MIVLVTGATGFIGSELTKQLVADGYDVRIMRRETSRLDLLGRTAKGVEQVEGDVTDPDDVRAAMNGVTHVYHTAASLGFGAARSPESLFEVNVSGTANVVDGCLEANVQRMVHTSSMAAFGRIENSTAAIDEDAVWHPSRANTAYGKSKHDAELEVQRGIAEGLDAVIVNPALVFGPGRRGENTMQIAEKVLNGKIPAIPAGGTNVVDVADVARGHILAMTNGVAGQRYFLGSENLEWGTIFETLAESLGVPPPRLRLSPRPAILFATFAEVFGRLTGRRPIITRETARVASHFYQYSNAKAVTALGCSFRPFAETAQRIAEHLLSERMRPA